MSRRQRGKALLRGRTIPYHPALARAVGTTPALVAQQLHFYSVGTPDGWVDISAQDLADDLGCGKTTAHGALVKLLGLGILERRDSTTAADRRRYRLKYGALEDLLPRHDLSEDVVDHLERLAEKPNADTVPNPNAEASPGQGSDSEPSRGRAQDVDVDVDVDPSFKKEGGSQGNTERQRPAAASPPVGRPDDVAPPDNSSDDEVEYVSRKQMAADLAALKLKKVSS